MNKINKYITPLLISLFALNSCTEVIDLEVPNGGARLVVEASINWEKGTTGENQIIKLSTSTAYFDSNPDMPAVGAIVRVTKENDGVEFLFEDMGDGIYTVTDFVPELNQEYSLEIIYNENTYSATETLVSVSEITSVEQGISPEFDDEIEITIYFNDPADELNFYLGEFIPSNEPLLSLNPLDDSFTNGNESFMVYRNEDLLVGDTVEISLYGISKTFYNYISILVSQSGGDGGPFPTTPVKLKGNCKNSDDPNEEVLGFFRLSEVDRVTHIIN